MTIAHDAASEATAGTGTLSWTHTPVGTPKGVFVGIAQNIGQTDEVTGVTYGGVAMTRTGTVADTAGEQGRAYMYFLGASIPTGAQTVQVSVNGTGSTKWAAAATVTAAANTQLAGNSPQTTSGDILNPSVTVSTIAGASFAAGVMFSGINAPANLVAGSGFTKRHDHDFGNQTAAFETSTNQLASGNQVIAFTNGGADDTALVGIAIEEAILGVTPGLISSTGSVFSPTITSTFTLALGLISNAGSVFSPTITQPGGSQSVTAGIISNVGATFSPTVTPGQVSVAPPLINAVAAIFAPELEQGDPPATGGYDIRWIAHFRRR